MAATEILQLRVDPQVKRDFESKCNDSGKTVSEALRALVLDDLYAHETPEAQLEGIFAAADERLEAAGLPEPTVAEIVEYCADVKAERASQMLVGKRA